MNDTAVIIVAAGKGFRARTHDSAHDPLPKQYQPLAGQPVLTHTVGAFIAHPDVSRIIVVIGAQDAALYAAAVAPFTGSQKLMPSTIGGDTRQASVLSGLARLAAAPPAHVLVHDAARPFVSGALISDALDAARTFGAAIPGIPVTDTIKAVDAAGNVTATPARAHLRAVQTPQAFAFPMLYDAHLRARDAGAAGLTDDAAIAEWAGQAVHVFTGDPDNMKLTTSADLDAARRRLEAPLVSRTGTGFDVHAFAEGDHIWLGGVRIAHTQGVIAHSDGDVVLHALTDAVLGALADGDIGSHFPPSDPRWKGASSDQFLAHAIALLHGRGGVLDHLDATVICERPKIGPHREQIRARIAAIAGLPEDAVSIKATTSERLGFTGRSEGIAAQAAATIRLPSRSTR